MKIRNRGAAWDLDVQRLERERVLRGLTQRELAKRAAVDEGTLCDLLARRRRPTFGTLGAVCQALGMTLADVILFEAAPEQVA